MGCSCVIKACEQENFEKSDIKFNVIKYQKDKHHIKKIIKIQSLFRGYHLRSFLKSGRNRKKNIFNTRNKNLSVQESTMRNNINFSKNIQNISTKIKDEEIRDLFISYPPLFFQNTDLQIKRIIELENFSEYYGECDINTNKRFGRGIQLWIDGSRYEGYWVNDKANIKGKLKHNDGDIYEGEWVDDKAEGHGIYIYNDGSKFEGEWKNDKKDGWGVEIGVDGSRYLGFFKNGKKNGKGKYEWNDGSFYEGDFFDDNLEGKGIYLWANGRKYDGEWKDNKMDGYGVFIWPDGRKYEGEYKNGKKEGHGIFRWKEDEKIYRGEWKNGKQHGMADFYNGNTKIWRKSIWFEGRKIKYVDDYVNNYENSLDDKNRNINFIDGDINQKSSKEQKKIFGDNNEEEKNIDNNKDQNN